MILRSTSARPPRVTRHAAAADTMLAASSRLMRSVFSRYACAESGAWVPRAAAAAALRATGRRRMATCGNTSSAQPSPRRSSTITSSVSCAPSFFSSFVSSFVSAECVETRTEVRVFVERERAWSRDDGPAGVAGVSAASSNPPSYSPLPHSALMAPRLCLARPALARRESFEGEGATAKSRAGSETAPDVESVSSAPLRAATPPTPALSPDTCATCVRRDRLDARARARGVTRAHGDVVRLCVAHIAAGVAILAALPRHARSQTPRPPRSTPRFP